jgi:hypothetical protein
MNAHIGSAAVRRSGTVFDDETGVLNAEIDGRGIEATG